jgi:hypothetical protein
MHLAANCKNHEKDATAALNAKPDEPTTAEFEDSVDLFPSLVVGGDIYKSFVQHVDGVFRQSVVDCYGCFVSLTEPTVTGVEINLLANEFKIRFAVQCWAIAAQLNCRNHMKNFRSQHLLPFYDRMIFCHFLSLSRVRCHRTFSWWALVNACMRHGSSCNSANTGLDSVFFGHSLVPWSVMRKTKEFRKMDFWVVQTRIGSTGRGAKNLGIEWSVFF